MKTQSIDTSPDAERVLIGLIREAPLTRRFSMVESWSRSVIEGGRLDVQQLHPQAPKQEVWLLYAERRYGKDVVAELRTALQKRGVQPSGGLDFRAPLAPVIEALDQLGVPFALGGSLASSLYGMQRATIQLDLIAALDPQYGELLSQQLASRYYFRGDEVKAALEQGTSFTLIHLESLFKIVVSLPKSRAFDREVLGRAHPLVLADGFPPIPVLCAADVAVLQLEQYKSSRERADDIWYDLLGLLKVQGPDLDLASLETWAAALDVAPLLERALADAGLREE